jgi:hypothetical protein
MGFYLRKSFGFGPVRLNLSKSGLGVSVGVKGLRLGTGPRGAYVHAGREGLYFRQSLTSAAPTEERTVEVSLTPPNALNDYDTVMWGSLLLGAALAIAGFTQAPHVSAVLHTAAGLPILLGIVLFWHRMRRLRQDAQRAEQREREESERRQLRHRYQAGLLQIAKGEDGAVLTDLRQIRVHPLFSRISFTEDERRAYWQALTWDLLQQAQGASPRAWGAQIARALSLDTYAAFQIRLAFYRTVWQGVLEDRALDPQEEATVQQVQTFLGLSDDEVQAERAILIEYGQARTIAALDPLPTIEVDIPLRAGEVCHHRTDGEVLDKRVAKRHQRDGQPHVRHEWVPTKSGPCYVTSKRVLIVGQGTSSIPHGKILDLEVDMDDRIIEITKDGRQEPTYLRVPDPIVTSAYLERLQLQRDDSDER